jgi:nitrite reductase/ring-hydroxylating ferredoxin subunit/uncharacterized membrane protein
MSETAIDTLQEQAWLDGAAESLTTAVRGAYDGLGDAGRIAKNALHGTWLGHPLHPVFTDLPIGAWTTAVVLDVAEDCTRDRGYGRAADVAIGVGLAGALGAAVTGLTDWSDTSGESKRLGLIHGVLNLMATSLYAASLAMRRGGQRESGRAVGLAGLALAYTSSYLGGALVFRDRIGVNQANDVTIDRPTPALPSDLLIEGTKRCVEVNGADVMVARQHGRVCALAQHCSHLGGPLSEGTLNDGSVVCPWHGSEFALDDGHVINGPATHPQPHFDARDVDGAIVIRPSANGER